MPYKDEEKNKEYQREYQRKWREKNREKALQIQAKHRGENRASINAKTKEKYHSNLEKSREKGRKLYDPDRSRAYYLENRKRILEANKKYRQENSELIAARNKKWFDENKERKHELNRVWRDKNKESVDAKRKERVWNLKIEVWGHYGGKCECCGANNKEFLTIDHINGGGTKHRKELRASGSQHIYSWLKRNNYPEGYRVLCMNCNFSHGMYGYCPHKNESNNQENTP